jgi:hypothetical protein
MMTVLGYKCYCNLLHVILCSDECGQLIASVFITRAAVPSRSFIKECSGKHSINIIRFKGNTVLYCSEI